MKGGGGAELTRNGGEYWDGLLGWEKCSQGIYLSCGSSLRWRSDLGAENLRYSDTKWTITRPVWIYSRLWCMSRNERVTVRKKEKTSGKAPYMLWCVRCSRTGESNKKWDEKLNATLVWPFNMKTERLCHRDKNVLWNLWCWMCGHMYRD